MSDGTRLEVNKRGGTGHTPFVLFHLLFCLRNPLLLNITRNRKIIIILGFSISFMHYSAMAYQRRKKRLCKSIQFVKKIKKRNFFAIFFFRIFWRIVYNTLQFANIALSQHLGHGCLQIVECLECYIHNITAYYWQLLPFTVPI